MIPSVNQNWKEYKLKHVPTKFGIIFLSCRCMFKGVYIYIHMTCMYQCFDHKHMATSSTHVARTHRDLNARKDEFQPQ